jgi:hypothetical protein
MNSGYSTHVCGGLVENWSFDGEHNALETLLEFENNIGVLWNPLEARGIIKSTCSYARAQLKRRIYWYMAGQGILTELRNLTRV